MFCEGTDNSQTNVNVIRRAELSDVNALAEFLVEQFWESEQFDFLTEGLADPKGTLEKIAASDLHISVTKGDAYIHGEKSITGIITGVPAKEYSILNLLINSINTRKIICEIPRHDLDLILNKMDLQKKIHNRTWFKKYSKNCYYISQVAVSKQSRGSGIFRKMITFVIEEYERKNMDIVLETFTESNVQMYEHFGFELVETHTSDEVPFSDYCMIKKV